MTIEIREAQPSDAEDLAGLIELLGHQVDADGVGRRMQRLSSDDLPQLVATEGGRVIGLCGLHRMAAIHRERPVGRVTILVVAPQWRGRGVGRMLVETAEAQLADAGCGMIEVTSNDRLVEAHRFYESVGYAPTSRRFAKQLD